MGSGGLGAEGDATSFDISAELGSPAADGERPISVELPTWGIDPAPIVPLDLDRHVDPLGLQGFDNGLQYTPLSIDQGAHLLSRPPGEGL